MAEAVDVNVDMGDLLKKLKILPDKIQKNVLTGAIRAGATLISKEAKLRVPVKTGLLKKSIGVVKHRKDRRNPTIVSFIIAPRSKYMHKNQKKPYNYGRIVEFGTSGRTPKPYMRPAYKTKGTQSIRAVEQYMEKRIDKELAKL